MTRLGLLAALAAVYFLSGKIGLQYFAEAVMPGLAQACGGQVKNPEIGVDYTSSPRAI